MIKKTKLTLLVLAGLLLFSCNNHEKDCSGYDSLISDRENSISEYYDQIDEWNTSNNRMRFLLNFTDQFSSGFDKIYSSIENNNQDGYNDSRIEVSGSIKTFFTLTLHDKWLNNEYFWIIEKSLEELENKEFNIRNECSELTRIEILEIEESLISVFYLMGYNDQYCFSKSEPGFRTYDLTKQSDTISYTIGHYAYDSTECAKISSTVSWNGGELNDSTNCNWFEIPRKPGLHKFKGTIYYQMFGEERQSDFNEEILIK